MWLCGHVVMCVLIRVCFVCAYFYVFSDGGDKSLVVKCRGLPYSASQGDIRDFFEGCAIARDGGCADGRDATRRSANENTLFVVE